MLVLPLSEGGARFQEWRLTHSEELSTFGGKTSMLVVIVSTALEEALDTLGGDVDFRRKGVSCAAQRRHQAHSMEM